MTGHVALVTGANHGIGAATAIELARRGAKVLVSYLCIDDPAGAGVTEAYRASRARDASHVLSAIQDAGGEAVAVEADLSDPAAAARLFDEAEATLGPVDILINNATGWVADTFTAHDVNHAGQSLSRIEAEKFDRQFAVDARAAALLIAEFADRHRARGAAWGRIVGLTSAGRDGFPGEVSYGAAKAALESYAKSAATELAPLGITANCVHPPVTDTGWVTDQVRALVKSSDELVHVAQPQDVARVIAWLVSDDAGMVTGNVVRMR